MRIIFYINLINRYGNFDAHGTEICLWFAVRWVWAMVPQPQQLSDFVSQTCVEVMWRQVQIHNKNKLTACGEHGMENNTLLEEEQTIKKKFRNFWHLSHSKMFSYQPTVVSVAYLFSTRSKIALKDMRNYVSAESEFFVLSYWFNIYTYLIYKKIT